MRSVVIKATLLALWLAVPALALAQEPDPPPPPPPAPRDVAVPRSAVPRAERPAVRDQETRTREPQSSGTIGGARRANATTDEGNRREPVREASTASTATADEEQRSGDGQRRGAVRRPSSDGSPRSGGTREGSATTRDRAVVRSEAPRQPDRVFVYPDYYRNYRRYYDPWGYGAFGLGYFYYSPWGWNPGYYGYPYGSYGYGGGGYGFDIGSVRLKVKPRDAEVYVDGYFAGNVDDFDGIFQALKLNSGGYRIEIRKPGFETLHFDVRVQPERTITYRGEMRAAP
jgi:hypothetical protein